MKYVIIHSHPAQGAAQIVVPATGPNDNPPNSSREEIEADDDAAAAAYVASRYEGRTGETRLFPLTDTTSEGAK